MTKSEQRALAGVLDLESRFKVRGIAMSSCRRHRLATMRGLVKSGHVREVLSVAVDGDGWTIEPERWRTAFALTVKGRKTARRAAEKAR